MSGAEKLNRSGAPVNPFTPNHSRLLMYSLLLTLHSWGRWAVLLGLLLALARAYWGWLGSRPFAPFDDAVRHTAATVAHVQLALGYGLYFSSPVVRSFHWHRAVPGSAALFFGLQHVAVMTGAVLVLTVGSALAKRRPTASAKFRTMTLWFSAALLLIFLAIPWPFSPLASRPFFRF